MRLIPTPTPTTLEGSSITRARDDDELRRSGFEVDVGRKPHLKRQCARPSIDSMASESPARRRWCFFRAMASSPTADLCHPRQCADLDRGPRCGGDGYSLDMPPGRDEQEGRCRSKCNFCRRFAKKHHRAPLPWPLAGDLAPHSVDRRGTVVMYAAEQVPVGKRRRTPRLRGTNAKGGRFGLPGRSRGVHTVRWSGLSRATQGEQIPWFSSSWSRIFRRTAGAGAPDPAHTPRGKKPPRSGPDPDAAVRARLQSAESAGTKKAGRISSRRIRPVDTPSWRVRNCGFGSCFQSATPGTTHAIKELDKKSRSTK